MHVHPFARFDHAKGIERRPDLGVDPIGAMRKKNGHQYDIFDLVEPVFQL